MRNEDGIWCDVNKGTRCGKKATYVHSCAIEGSEFAMCQPHEREWRGKTAGKPAQQTRCPRCLPQFLAAGGGRAEATSSDGMPDPITGPLAEAFNEAMFREGILEPTRKRVLQRLGGVEDIYVRGIFRSSMRQATAVREASG